MTTRDVSFYSDGVRLDGIVSVPDDWREGERRPAVVFVHGRLGLKEWVPPRWAPQFLAAGYVFLAFDFRNLGTSDGQPGRLAPEEEVRDALHAVTFLQQQPEVDPDRIGMAGWGLGGGLAVAAAARDPRIKVVASAAGLGDAGRVVRDDVPYEAWMLRQKELAQDRIDRVLTGKSKMISAWEVTKPGIAVADGSRSPLERWELTGGFKKQMQDAIGIGDTDQRREGTSLGHGLPDEFTMESAEALYAFRPEEEVHRISPRPLMIVHGEDDTYYAVDEARSLYAKAGEPKELVILPEARHLDWIDLDNPLHKPTVGRVVSFFDQYLSTSSPD